jgi:hypothetical protein
LIRSSGEPAFRRIQLSLAPTAFANCAVHSGSGWRQWLEERPVFRTDI